MSYQVSRDDLKFKSEIESCEFEVSGFGHREHLRLAYIYLVETKSVVDSLELVKNALLGLLKHARIEPSAKYHETLTEAWLLAVHHFMHKQGETKSADDFINQAPELLNSKIMLTHYSQDVLLSEEAKARFVSPNLEPIPRHARLSA